MTEVSFAKVHLIRQPAAATFSYWRRLNLKLCTNSPITEVSFAYFSFQRKVRSKKSTVKEKCGKIYDLVIAK